MRIKKGDVLKLKKGSNINLLSLFPNPNWKKPDLKIEKEKEIFIIISDFYFDSLTSQLHSIFNSTVDPSSGYICTFSIYEKLNIEVIKIREDSVPIYSVDAKNLLLKSSIEISEIIETLISGDFEHVFDEHYPEETDEKYLKIINKNK